MTLTVKSVRVLDTDDGYAFECTVYWKGKKVGTAMNGGFGGPDSYTIPQAIIDEIDAYGKTLPAIKFDDMPDADPMHHDIATLIGAAIGEFESRRLLKRELKKYVLLVDQSTQKVLKARRISASTGKDETDAIIARAKKSHPTFTALNPLPEDEAFNLARAAQYV